MDKPVLSVGESGREPPSFSGTWCVVAFYRFFPFPDYQEQRQDLLDLCLKHGLCGTILLAPEGINGTVGGPLCGIRALMEAFRKRQWLVGMEWKYSASARKPFSRMKVRLKKEIVTLGSAEANPLEQVGNYVEAGEWNALIQDPEVRVIDTRNDFEVDLGSFAGAENPRTASFREFVRFVETRMDPAKDKKIAMFCTGGIRCEKATSLLKARGFEEVYHLKGGILRYLEKIPQEQSLWEGQCFVFDQRVSVGHGLLPGDLGLCHACQAVLSAQDRQSPLFEAGVSCPHCHGKKSPEKLKAFRDREKGRRQNER